MQPLVESYYVHVQVPGIPARRQVSLYLFDPTLVRLVDYDECRSLRCPAWALLIGQCFIVRRPNPAPDSLIF